MKVIFIIAAILLPLGFLFSQNNSANNEWKVPESASSVTNPLKGNIAATEEGKKLFIQMCAVCHGDKGKGDGIGGLTLTPKPRNFTLAKTQQQTDGALFWKLTEGRTPMASYKDVLTSTQRWQLVNFIRTFKK